MNEDELVRQLREADEAAGPPSAPPSDLARRVLCRWRRRRWRRRAGTTAAAAVILVIGAWYFSSDRSDTEGPALKGPRQGDQDEIARLRVSLQVLSARAEAHQAAADQLLALEWRRRHLDAMGRVRSGGRLEEMRRQLDRAAFLTLRRAELLLREIGNKPGAMAAYQQVIDTFPETPWAQIARQRQSILRDKTGETL
jgi:hypothetical protein